MKALLVILVFLAFALGVPAFLRDIKVPFHTDSSSVVSDGTRSQVVSSKVDTTELSLRPLARVGLVLDTMAIVLVAFMLQRKPANSNRVEL